MTRSLPPIEIGTRFGDWEVVAQLTQEVSASSGQKRALCSRVRCVCGTEKTLRNSYLLADRSHGCGCRRGQALAYSGITHGKSYTPLYKYWAGLKHRLVNDRHYEGIQLYEPWTADFLAFEGFIQTLGPKPTPQHTLDRIDPNGDYAPGNLRWADKTTQSINRRNSMLRNVLTSSLVGIGQKYDMLTVLDVSVIRKHGRNWYSAKVQCDCGTIKMIYQKQLLSPKTKSCGCYKNKNLLLGHKALEKPITANGETLSLRAWARRQGISPQVIWNRIHKLGWDPVAAVSGSLRESKTIEARGERLTYEQCEQRYGLPVRLIRKRIEKLGWDPVKAVTMPARQWLRKEPKTPGA